MNEKGFVTLSFVLLAPLLMALLFGAFWILWFLNQKHAMDNICHEGVLASQERLVSGNKKLMAMNSLAYSYIFEKRILDAIILTAPPQIKVVAKIRRRMVVYQQKTLAKAQKGLIHMTSLTARTPLFNLRRKFYGKVQSIQAFWRTKGLGGGQISIFPSRTKMEVKIRDIASVYKRSTDHERKQEIRAHWRVPLRDLSPPFLKKLIPIHSQWSGSCGSHPHKGGHRWFATIGAAKHSSKHLY